MPSGPPPRRSRAQICAYAEPSPIGEAFAYTQICARIVAAVVAAVLVLISVLLPARAEDKGAESIVY